MARTSSPLRNKFFYFIIHYQVWILGLFALLSLCIYHAVSFSVNNRVGFPLDDSWIHQTYARNLATRGEWAFVPGQPSAGATSPFWVALLALGNLLGVPYFVWTFGLGFLSLWGVALAGAWIFRKLFPERPILAFLVALFLIFEWHLVWAAAAGMETLLFATLCVGLFVWTLQIQVNQSLKKWIVAGLLVGLSVWVRPEGLTLLGPVGLLVLFTPSSNHGKPSKLGALVLGFALLFIPYLAFNYSIAGSFLPNTFYAKQAEISAYLARPFWVRLGEQLFQPLVGAGLLLLPGLIYLFYREINQRRWPLVIWSGWIVAYLTLVAVRLPSTIQHGRYAMPVMPLYFLLAMAGTATWAITHPSIKWAAYLRAVWIQVIGVLLVVMYVIAAPAYVSDVAFIESEMVAVANWIEANTPADALIATHDIGAIGYFSNRNLLDLAGLVTPEVIPFMRDEDRLADYLDAQGADYLVSFLTWYPHLILRAELLFQTHGEISPALGGENMAVYRWLPDSD